MPSPSAIIIYTSSITRLLKEQATYKQELAAQEKRLEVLKREQREEGGTEEEERGNAEFLVGQEERAIQETKNVFGPLRERLAEAVGRLEQLIRDEGRGAGRGGREVLGDERREEVLREERGGEVERAREVLGEARGWLG